MLICAFSPRPVRTACATHSALITGSMPGKAGIDEADLAVGFRAECGRRAAEQLGVADHLGMDLQADHDLPRAGAALK